MSSLKERLQQDWKDALKQKLKFKASVISMAKAAILTAEKADGSSLNDDQIIEVLAKEVKQRRDAVLEFEKGNRQDLIDSSNMEIDILLQYLPKQLTEDEVRQIIVESAEKLGANSMKDMGKIMSDIRPIVNGRADGKIVSQIVKEYLNK